jgi:hypothetical protein
VIETSANLKAFIAEVVADRELLAVELDASGDVTHPRVHPDQLLPSVDLPQPDSPASPMISPSAISNDAPSDGLHVAAERLVVDRQAVDAEAHLSLSFGLKTSSRPRS